MTITLNHTIVPARDKEAAARFFAQIFGLAYKGVDEHFAPVKVNDTLTFLFDDDTNFENHLMRSSMPSSIGFGGPGSPMAVCRHAPTMGNSMTGAAAGASISRSLTAISSN
jgi:catechol 2,3-dioxygenase-like lactoylglutathione lyase family enzyme